MAERASPDDMARLIAKRPGMHLGGASYERAIGFLHGLASIVAMRRASTSADAAPDEFSADSGSELLGRIASLRRDPDLDDHEAIRRLEPLIAATIAAFQELDEV